LTCKRCECGFDHKDYEVVNINGFIFHKDCAVEELLNVKYINDVLDTQKLLENFDGVEVLVRENLGE